MLISTGTMAQVIGVSRLTYYNWLGGKPIRKLNAEKVTSAVRILLSIVRDHKWPTAEEVALTPKMREQRLLALYARYQ